MTYNNQDGYYSKQETKLKSSCGTNKWNEVSAISIFACNCVNRLIAELVDVETMDAFREAGPVYSQTQR